MQTIESYQSAFIPNNGRVIAYVRVSTEDQTVEQQKAAIRLYCAMRGLGEPEFFEDPGVSGYFVPFARRQGGAQVDALIAAGEVAHLVTVRLDRLWRERVDAISTEARWAEKGVTIHFTDEGGCAFDTRTAMGKFVFTFRVAQAEFERDLISERTRAKLSQMRKPVSDGGRGVVLGVAPFGKRKVDAAGLGCGEQCRGGEHAGHGALVALADEPSELPAVRRMRELAASGETQERIAKRLTAEGYATRGGGAWHRRSVQSVLGQEAA